MTAGLGALTVTVIVTVTANGRTNGEQDEPGDRYTLDELSARVAERIGELALTQSNGQVAATPDGRTLRYYASLGLLDRPAEVRGRRALYGDRHVLQAVAVKALQSAGLSLGEIQHRLTGRSDADLEAVVLTNGSGSAPTASRFWRQPVAPPEPTAVVGASGGTATAGHNADADARAGRSNATDPDADRSAPEPAAIRLGPGAILVLEPTRPPTTDDATALRRAATDLLDELRRRGLTDHDQEG